MQTGRPVAFPAIAVSHTAGEVPDGDADTVQLESEKFAICTRLVPGGGAHSVLVMRAQTPMRDRTGVQLWAQAVARYE